MEEEMNCNCRDCEKSEIPLWLIGLAAFVAGGFFTVLGWVWGC